MFFSDFTNTTAQPHCTKSCPGRTDTARVSLSQLPAFPFFRLPAAAPHTLLSNHRNAVIVPQSSGRFQTLSADPDLRAGLCHGSRPLLFISCSALDDGRSPDAMICNQACIMASGSSLSQKTGSPARRCRRTRGPRPAMLCLDCLSVTPHPAERPR